MKTLHPQTNNCKHTRSRFARRAAANAFGRDLRPPEWDGFRDRRPPNFRLVGDVARRITSRADTLRRAQDEGGV